MAHQHAAFLGGVPEMFRQQFATDIDGMRLIRTMHDPRYRKIYLSAVLVDEPESLRLAFRYQGANEFSIVEIFYYVTGNNHSAKKSLGSAWGIFSPIILK
jgi:hypothetical protein